MIRFLRWVMFAAIGVVASAAQGALSHGEMRDLLERADERFTEATRLAESDAGTARELFDESIVLWRRVLEEGEIASGPIHYNIANAFLLGGDLGWAILEYRRAERLMGSDENLSANLAQARLRVRSRIDPPDQDRAARLLLFWHHDLAPQARFVLLCAAFALVWVMAGLRLLPVSRGAWTWWGAGLALVVSAAMMGSLLIEQRAEESVLEGVVVAPSAVGRRGPDDSVYGPTFAEPLFQGVEFRVVEERVGWLLVEFGDGRTTWLKISVIELI